MAQNPDRFSRFWNELKRRKTDRVIVVYAATAFTILQLEPILESAFSLPAWTSTILIIVIAAGFPVAAIFSWFFDITSGGIEKTKPLKTSERQKIQAELKRWRWITVVSVIVIIILIFFNIIRSGINSNEIRRSEKSIAVIPFENLSPDAVMPFSGEVLASIIRTKLKMTEEFNVCSGITLRGSATKKLSVPEIARKLNVFFIVTGEMAKIKNIILININLLSKKGRLIWAHEYSMTREDEIEVLDGVPFEIVKKLKVEIAPGVKRKLNLKLTKSPAAYLSYVEGEAVQDLATEASRYTTKGDSTFNDLRSAKSFEKAISLYDKAIEEDSTFALAYVKRAITRSWGFNAGHFSAKDHKEKCREDIEHALRLDKNLLEAKVAYGFYYYYFCRDLDQALEYFIEVSKADPKYWQSKFYMGLVYRAHGQWEESQKLMREVVKSNPLDALFITNIGLSYHYLHVFDSAVYFHNKAIRLMPQWADAYQNKIEALIARDGNTIAAEAVLDSAESMVKNTYLSKNRILFDLYNGKFNDALLKATIAGPEEFFSNGEKYMILAEIYRNLKSSELSKNYYRLAFDYFSKKQEENPDRPKLLSYLGLALGGLNEKLKAVEYGQKGIDLSEGDFMEKSERELDLAKIYVLIGENDKCLYLLNELLKNQSTIGYRILQLDPVWRPLRNMTKYKEMINHYSER
jgi:TolB-like protein/Tfp pilus assembly protein PilF